MSRRLSKVLKMPPVPSDELSTRNSTMKDIIIKDQSCPVYAYINSLHEPRSQQTARRALMAIAKHLGVDSIYQICWSKFDRNQLNSLLTLLRKRDLSPDTISLYLSVIKRVVMEAFLLGQINPLQYERIKSIKRPSGSRVKTHHLLDRDGFTKLLNTISNWPQAKQTSIRDQAIFHLLVGCGLRRFEISELHIEQIQQDTKHLKFIGKGNKERLVKLHDLTFLALKKWVDIHPYKTGPLFVRLTKAGTAYGKISDTIKTGISGHAIYNLCKKYHLLRQEAYTPPHTLRRSYATWLYNNGVDLKKLAALLGHSSIKTTEIYILEEQDSIDTEVVTKLFI
ncbi:Tyrosine recombinase XerC [Pseudoalteromonas holothuriae]|uniref:Tyrosine recombinase XerC n=2 Tax=Pseudoalteromonas holothuriae TaxID=2963714 RepID=A0A9W4W3L8_9GAMM|nr:Tyrosine recombinase XerC [Pseudoalteromonas sp. CIP111854]CAH9068223.1 Tyrosine recombinase XerC [Pseudoalteromonas sp. CIP111951]